VSLRSLALLLIAGACAAPARSTPSRPAVPAAAPATPVRAAAAPTGSPTPIVLQRPKIDRMPGTRAELEAIVRDKTATPERTADALLSLALLDIDAE
jgi:hypothetical protein